MIFATSKDFVLEHFNGFDRREASTTKERTPEEKVSWKTLKKYGALMYTEEMEKRSKDFALHFSAQLFLHESEK